MPLFWLKLCCSHQLLCPYFSLNTASVVAFGENPTVRPRKVKPYCEPSLVKVSLLHDSGDGGGGVTDIASLKLSIREYPKISARSAVDAALRRRAYTRTLKLRARAVGGYIENAYGKLASPGGKQEMTALLLRLAFTTWREHEIRKNSIAFDSRRQQQQQRIGISCSYDVEGKLFAAAAVPFELCQHTHTHAHARV